MKQERSRCWRRDRSTSSESGRVRENASVPAHSLGPILRALRAGFHYDYCRKLGQLAAADVVVIVGNDQTEAFSDRNMPAFSIFWGEQLINRPPTEEQIKKGHQDPQLRVAAIGRAGAAARWTSNERAGRAATCKPAASRPKGRKRARSLRRHGR